MIRFFTFHMRKGTCVLRKAAPRIIGGTVIYPHIVLLHFRGSLPYVSRRSIERHQSWGGYITVTEQGKRTPLRGWRDTCKIQEWSSNRRDNREHLLEPLNFFLVRGQKKGWIESGRFFPWIQAQNQNWCPTHPPGPAPALGGCTQKIQDRTQDQTKNTEQGKKGADKKKQNVTSSETDRMRHKTAGRTKPVQEDKKNAKDKSQERRHDTTILQYDLSSCKR